MNTFGSIVFFIIVFLIGSFVFNNFIRNDWIGMYESRTSNVIYTQKFSSMEECADWLAEAQRNPGAYINYECGKNCEEPKTELGLYKCQETF